MDAQVWCEKNKDVKGGEKLKDFLLNTLDKTSLLDRKYLHSILWRKPF